MTVAFALIKRKTKKLSTKQNEQEQTQQNKRDNLKPSPIIFSHAFLTARSCWCFVSEVRFYKHFTLLNSNYDNITDNKLEYTLFFFYFMRSNYLELPQTCFSKKPWCCFNKGLVAKKQRFQLFYKKFLELIRNLLNENS